jgi:hypothetical protein
MQIDSTALSALILCGKRQVSSETTFCLLKGEQSVNEANVNRTLPAFSSVLTTFQVFWNDTNRQPVNNLRD